MFVCYFFFFNDTATTEIYTLSLHDALPICFGKLFGSWGSEPAVSLSRTFLMETAIRRTGDDWVIDGLKQDRKSTRLNSSHGYISYAVFCLKKKIIII